MATAFWVVRCLLGLRYRIRTQGLAEIRSLKGHKPGVLFLPNHPAEIDPILLMCILGPRFFPRCVVVEHFYRLKGFQWILDLVRVLPVPSMAEQANQWRGKEVAKILGSIQEQIHEGENFIIYPSGKLKRSGLERIGGASFVHSLLQEDPQIPIVLVRTTGLWGSSFSVAQTGESPHFASVFKKGIGTLFKNFLFFTPRRDVFIEFEKAGPTLPKEESRLVFNRYLEQWYNRYPFPGEEPLSLIPYSTWNQEEVEIHVAKAAIQDEETVRLPKKIEQEILECLAKLAHVEISHIQTSSHLSFDLGLDSLDISQVYLFLDQKYGLQTIEPGSLNTVKDVFKAVAEKGEIPSYKEEKRKAPIKGWEDKEMRKEPMIFDAGVIQEVFLRCSERMGNQIAAGDRNSGVFSYKELRRAALVLSLKIRKEPGDYIGILLPSSVAAYMTILAVLLAGKIPVMLNWTVGRVALSHALKITGFQRTITSKKFLDKIQLEDLSEIEETFVFLEEIKASLSWKDKLKGAYLSSLSTSKILKELQIDQDPEKTAVLLFTTGTESMPKAVPLSHLQILTNQKSGLSCVDIGAKDVLYGVLPPFHSFGFSLTGLLPLLYGIKVFYAPDPTDSRSMAFDIEEAKVTLFCCAPSFVRGLCSVADAKQMQSLRLIVVGAERMPKDLEKFIEEKWPRVSLLEGYGITECAPIVTLQKLSEKRQGVGKPIPQMRVCIVNPSTLELLQTGEEGEICISGPCVFDGYFKRTGKDPFFYQGKRKWYRSGDLGKVDEEGNVYLTDRLKRIMKIGAEMISLGGVEEELLHAAKERMWYPSSHEGPPLALVSRETESQKAELVLFTVFSISPEEVNQILRESGFGRLIKISEVVQIEEIPLTGTGKIHHRLLEERLKKCN